MEESKSLGADLIQPAELVTLPTKDGVQSVYSNNFSFASTLFDVRVTFGEVIGITPEKQTVEQRVAVTMCWQQVKILAEFLKSNIAYYEQKNGVINVPDAAMSFKYPLPTVEVKT